MLWVGLTGGIASGKSTVTGLLRAQSLAVICADELAHEVIRKGTSGHAEVVKLFGPSVVGANGEIDRKAVGSRVFADRSQLQELENIIHPRVRALSLEKKAELAQRGEKIAFYDVPLLFEKQMESLFDQIVLVSCSPENQLARLMKRNGFSKAEAEKRIAAQIPLLQKIHRSHFVISNDGTLQELEQNVLIVVRRLLDL